MFVFVNVEEIQTVDKDVLKLCVLMDWELGRYTAQVRTVYNQLFGTRNVSCDQHGGLEQIKIEIETKSFTQFCLQNLY